MKNLTVLLFLSFSFSAFWISYDVQYEAESSGVIYDFDTGALTVGYEKKLPSNNLIFGLGYDLKGAELGGEYDSDTEWTCMNIYAKYPFQLDNNSFLFGTFGYTIPTGDADDAGLDSGISLGFGYSHSSGIGLSYTIHQSGIENSYYDSYYGSYYSMGSTSIDLNRLSISYTF